jgi:hypothetical protein
LFKILLVVLEHQEAVLLLYGVVQQVLVVMEFIQAVAVAVVQTVEQHLRVVQEKVE